MHKSIKHQAGEYRDEVAAGTIGFQELVTLKAWAEDPRRNCEARLLRRLGGELYKPALRAFKAREQDMRVVVYPVAGVYLLPSRVFHYTILGSSMAFDWAEAQRLIFRIDALAEQALEWWSASRKPQARTTPPSTGREPDAAAPGAAPSHERKGRAQPHLERAFSIMTAIFSAMDLENERHQAAKNPTPLARAHELGTAAFVALDKSILPTDSQDAAGAPSPRFLLKISLLRAEVERAEFLLALAAQRQAQARYARGMLWGGLILAVFCLVVGEFLAKEHVDAHYAVAAPAGAIGAMVSVLQRMTSGNLSLDVHAGTPMLRLLGGVRPFVGAVLGFALYLFFAGGLLPWPAGADTKVEFIAAIGFLSGFNERFAQDMLAGSAKKLAQEAEPPSASSS